MTLTHLNSRDFCEKRPFFSGHLRRYEQRAAHPLHCLAYRDIHFARFAQLHGLGLFRYRVCGPCHSRFLQEMARHFWAEANFSSSASINMASAIRRAGRLLVLARTILIAAAPPPRPGPHADESDMH